ncbi:helix-turn-helix domain-containing protein [Streptomyces sp. AV19]|uniref:helix-turn-helix domain-containing protein n=1 Tax=Streptomyces sp. AV19 TaxID=2793068 RepID=UPI0018FE05D6|nr:helix-turn-helix transcriptional regulator [Streptomyces sp. AV19]MBH1938443.1 helix-turn-helix domain-containing protein [Streptomyces sp. AV19]MDG4535091.1 helix-turn-helix domain-containing protein [Streptomyces sp. AV19]
MAAKKGPTIRRVQLGKELRRLRERAGMSLVQAVDGLAFSDTKLWRVERGMTSLDKLSDLRSLCERYGIEDEEDVEFLLKIQRESLSRDWWIPYRNVMPSGMEMFIGLERDARRLRGWQPNVVYGLLQSERYARALFEAAKPVEETTTEFMEYHLQLRMERKELITRSEDPVELRIIMSEGALRQVLGDAELMREQYVLIAELAGLDNVTVQVLPWATPAYRATNNFVLMDFESPLPSVVEIDDAKSVTLVDKQSEIWKHTRRFDSMCASALNPGETPRFLERLAREQTR